MYLTTSCAWLPYFLSTRHRAYQTVNAVELCIDAVGEMQKEFYSNYPQHEKEAEYKFVAPSSLKPTQVHACAPVLEF